MARALTSRSLLITHRLERRGKRLGLERFIIFERGGVAAVGFIDDTS